MFDILSDRTERDSLQMRTGAEMCLMCATQYASEQEATKHNVNKPIIQYQRVVLLNYFVLTHN